MSVPVVIVGAGPTGVVAATLLARHGVESIVLERWPGVYPQPRAVHLDDEIYRILARLGVAEEFAAISRPSEGLRLVDRRHRVLAQFDRSGGAPTSGHPRANMFDQPDLELLLRHNLKRHPAATLRGDVEVTCLRPLAPGRVEVSLLDRSTDRPETIETRYVLGCDGANSVVRSAIGASYDDLGFEQRWLVVDVESRVDLGQWEGVHQVCDTDRAGTYMRIGATRHRWEFRLHDDESATTFDTLATLRPLIEPWAGHVGDADLDLVRVADYTFRAKVADRWRRGNVFLLGDAAHLTPPFIGQGMGAGIRDAANLAWKLAGTIDGSLPESVLDSYESERRPHATSLIGLARTTGVLMTAGGVTGDIARRTLLPALSRLPRVRAHLLDSETPALEDPTWARRSSRDRLAGRLVPSPELEGRRLDARLGDRWAVISRRAPSPSDEGQLRRRGIELVSVIDEHPLGVWLIGGGAVAALVRPDRTVLLSADDTSTVCATAASLEIVASPILRE